MFYLETPISRSSPVWGKMPSGKHLHCPILDTPIVLMFCSTSDPLYQRLPTSQQSIVSKSLLLLDAGTEKSSSAFVTAGPSSPMKIMKWLEALHTFCLRGDSLNATDFLLRKKASELNLGITTSKINICFENLWLFVWGSAVLKA